MARTLAEEIERAKTETAASVAKDKKIAAALAKLATDNEGEQPSPRKKRKATEEDDASSSSPAKKKRGRSKSNTRPSPRKKRKAPEEKVASSPSPAKKKRGVKSNTTSSPKKQKKETTKVAAMKHSVGTKIAKAFKRDIYYGAIESIDVENRWYHVVYDDADEEDFADDEIDKYLANDSTSGKKKRGKKK